MRKKIVAGNWKMNLTRTEALSLVSEVRDLLHDKPEPAVTTVVCPPAIHLSPIQKLLEGQSHVHLGAQNCHQEEKGAFTGEVSATMLASYHVNYVILGHSERRQYFAEDAQTLKAKVRQALDQNLQVIFCCGESLEIREAETHLSFVANQLSEVLFDFSAEELKDLAIAYEPIWAIGTGKTASSAQAQAMHKHLREHIGTHFGADFANQLPILYGGSCKPANAEELFAQPDVDGGLIGGASLKSKDFVAIVRSF